MLLEEEEEEEEEKEEKEEEEEEEEELDWEEISGLLNLLCVWISPVLTETLAESFWFQISIYLYIYI